jgi:hypothetical protein
MKMNKVWAKAKETADHLKITTEVDCSLSEVPAEVGGNS